VARGADGPDGRSDFVDPSTIHHLVEAVEFHHEQGDFHGPKWHHAHGCVPQAHHHEACTHNVCPDAACTHKGCHFEHIDDDHGFHVHWEHHDYKTHYVWGSFPRGTDNFAVHYNQGPALGLTGVTGWYGPA
jgi:hypothetical protein